MAHRRNSMCDCSAGAGAAAVIILICVHIDTHWKQCGFDSRSHCQFTCWSDCNAIMSDVCNSHFANSFVERIAICWMLTHSKQNSHSAREKNSDYDKVRSKSHQNFVVYFFFRWTIYCFDCSHCSVFNVQIAFEHWGACIPLSGIDLHGREVRANPQKETYSDQIIKSIGNSLCLHTNTHNSLHFNHILILIA